MSAKTSASAGPSRIEDDLPRHDVTSTIASFATKASTHPPRVLVLYGSLEAGVALVSKNIEVIDCKLLREC
jgi:hypothetical protein